jgi:hypothetical protein
MQLVEGMKVRSIIRGMGLSIRFGEPANPIIGAAVFGG